MKPRWRASSHTIDTEMRGLGEMRAALGNGLAKAFLAGVHAIEAWAGAVVVTGIGKSGHIGRKIAATLASTGTHSHFVHPAEAGHGEPRDDFSARRGARPLMVGRGRRRTCQFITYTKRFG